jgi:lactate permease
MVAFCFGAFMEGFAGFGAPVAISAALMIGLGFRPLDAAKAALIGNTVPVAFGSVGIPIVTLAKVTGLDESVLSAMVGRQLPFFALLIPFWLVAALSGWRGMLCVWPACLVAGASFAGAQFWVSNHHGPHLVAAAAGLTSIAALLVLLRFWKPRDEQPHVANSPADTPTARQGGRESFRAWLPWALLILFVAAASYAPVKTALDRTFAPKISVPALHLVVQKMPPVVAKPEAEAALFTFNLLSATGTWLLIAGLLAGLLASSSAPMRAPLPESVSRC